MATRGTDQGCSCRYYADAPDHHDLLLRIENATFDELTSIIELAVTWHELDYSESRFVEPESWGDFVSLHRWQDEHRVTDFFLAAQGLGSVRGKRPDLAVVVSLRDGDDRHQGSSVLEACVGPTYQVGVSD